VVRLVWQAPLQNCAWFFEFPRNIRFVDTPGMFFGALVPCGSWQLTHTP
jgi:hypothetical protein